VSVGSESKSPKHQTHQKYQTNEADQISPTSEHSLVRRQEQPVVADTYDKVLRNDEYLERIEVLTNSTRQLEQQLSSVIASKDAKIYHLQKQNEQDSEEQLNEIILLSDKLDKDLSKYKTEIFQKDSLVKDMKRTIKELQGKGDKNLHHLQREKEVQMSELQKVAEMQMDQYRDKFEAEIDNLKLQYDERIQEMEKQKKNVARSISNKRSSVSGSKCNSSRRHSSVKASRNRASRNGNEASFTVESRYPVKRKGIGEQTPPKLDLDQYPTRDRKFDRSINPVKLSQNGGLKRFKDQVYFEQKILNLEEKLDQKKIYTKELIAEISELKRINKVMGIENKIAISLILNGNNSKGYNPNWHNDEKVEHLISAIQYIID
jgi:hypothetical protein